MQPTTACRLECIVNFSCEDGWICSDPRALSDMQGDGAGAPLAAMGALRALHLGGTGVGDALLAALTFRIRLDAWSRDAGACSHGAAQLVVS